MSGAALISHPDDGSTHVPSGTGAKRNGMNARVLELSNVRPNVRSVRDCSTHPPTTTTNIPAGTNLPIRRAPLIP